MNYEEIYNSPRLRLYVTDYTLISTDIRLSRKDFTDRELNIINSSLNSLVAFEVVAVMFTPQSKSIMITIALDFSFIGVVTGGSHEQFIKLTGKEAVYLIKEELNMK